MERLTLLRDLCGTRDPVVRRKYADATIAYADSLLAHGFGGDTAVLARKASGIFSKGKSMELRGAADSAVIWYRKSIVQLEVLDRRVGAARVRSHLYGALMNTGDARAAATEIQRCLVVYGELNDTMEVASAHLKLGRAYS